MAAAKRLQRVGNHLAQWRLIPVPAGKQLMGFAERAQARLEGFSLGRRRMPQGLAGNRLNGCERVLDAMLALVDKQLLGLLGTAALEAEARTRSPKLRWNSL